MAKFEILNARRYRGIFITNHIFSKETMYEYLISVKSNRIEYRGLLI